MKKYLKLCILILLISVVLVCAFFHGTTSKKVTAPTDFSLCAPSEIEETITQATFYEIAQKLQKPTEELTESPTQPHREATVKKDMTCTLIVSCESVFSNPDLLNPSLSEILPKDAIIYSSERVPFTEGETVFDVLLREMKNNNIHLEFSQTPVYNSTYIEAINNLYEFDCGELSGWMYSVNNVFPGYGCSNYVLSDKDVVKWQYTCNLGKDLK